MDTSTLPYYNVARDATEPKDRIDRTQERLSEDDRRTYPHIHRPSVNESPLTPNVESLVYCPVQTDYLKIAYAIAIVYLKSFGIQDVR